VVKPERTPVRIAYLLSQYPAVNHVFMTREVRLLRRCGIEIHAFSIGGPDRPLAAMTDGEREEVLATYYVKNAGFLQLAGAHVSTLFSRPISYSRGLWCALRMGMWSPHRMLYGVFYFGEAILVGRSMMRLGLRHLHTHFASTVALIVARTFPVTFSATFHGHGEFGDPTAFRLREKIHASLFSCAVSRHGLSQLMYVSGRSQWPKLELTPLGVDLAEFAPRPFRSDASAFQIVSVGQLVPVKGQHVLIGAAAALVSEGHDVVVRFVGDGPDRSELEREVEARGLSRSVLFVGNVNQDELRAIYGDSDALVLSSFGEGLPVVLMEAMAMEIPCIATWVAGVPELIRDGTNGLLVPPADEGSLAGAILRLMSDPDLRFKLGREARRTVLDQYDLDKNGERLVEIFRRRLDVRQPGRNLDSPTRGASST
jgi:glycosyltransferase involved in cell wall biosynthesis